MWSARRSLSFLALLMGVAGILAMPAVSASVARACSFTEPVAFSVDAALRATDSTPPDPFTKLVADVRRVPRQTCRDGQCTSLSCDSSATATISFELPRAVSEDEDALGYRIVWLRGSIPPAATRELGSIWPLGRGDDGKGLVGIAIGFDQVEDLDAEVALIAVDRAGNESQPSEPVHLEFSGCTIDLFTGACEESTLCSVAAVGPERRSSAWAVGACIACAATLGLRRRKRRA